MPRKVRSDIKIGNLEKKLGLSKGAIRNPDGSDARSDKKLGTLQEEYQRLFAGPPVRTNTTAKSKQKTPKPSQKATTSTRSVKSTSTKKSAGASKK